MPASSPLETAYPAEHHTPLIGRRKGIGGTETPTPKVRVFRTVAVIQNPMFFCRELQRIDIEAPDKILHPSVQFVVTQHGPVLTSALEGNHGIEDDRCSGIVEGETTGITASFSQIDRRTESNREMFPMDEIPATSMSPIGSGSSPCVGEGIELIENVIESLMENNTYRVIHPLRRRTEVIDRARSIPFCSGYSGLDSRHRLLAHATVIGGTLSDSRFTNRPLHLVHRHLTLFEE